jgi:isoleucyl-tRNA synthetase
LINILRNTKSFYALHKDDAPVASNASRNVLDRWVLTRLDEMIGEATQGFDRYDTVRATRPMRAFVDDFSTWYVRRSRDRIKSDDAADKDRALATMRYVLREFSKVIAPVMPFIAEEIYQEVRTEDEPVSVHLTDWPKVPEGLFENMKKALGLDGTEGQLIDDMAEVRAVVTLALEARQKAGIKVRQPLSELKVNSAGLLGKADLIQLIADEINVKHVSVSQAMEERVWLDTTLTTELIKEGEFRDLVREVQDLRKTADMNPKDQAVLLVPESKAALVDEHWDALSKAANLKNQQVSPEFGVYKA